MQNRNQMSYNELAKEINRLQIQNEMLENEIPKIQKIENALLEDISSEDPFPTSIEKRKDDQQNSESKQIFNENDSDSSKVQSFIELNSDMTVKLNKITSQLRSLQKENAELKKSISIVEAENAKLITENQELKSQVDSLSNSSIIQLQEKDSQLDLMKNELQKAKNNADQVSQMIKENSLFKQEVINFHEKLAKHKEELKRAQKEIKRLTEKNNQSDDQIAEMEKLLNLNKNNLQMYQQNQELIDNYRKRMQQKGDEENSSVSFISYSSISQNDNNSSNQQVEYLNCQKKLLRDLRELKAFCISLRDENKSLHNENKYLNEKLRNRSSKRHSSPKYIQTTHYAHHRSPSPRQNISPENRLTNDYNGSRPNQLSNHEQYNQNSGYPPMSYTNDVVKAIVSRCMNTFILKMELLNTKILTSIDHLSLVINHFQGTYKQSVLYQQKALTYRRPLNDIESSEQFLENLRREIRIIQSLSNCYAKSHNIPKSAIPKPDQLIGNHVALLNFLDPENHTHQRLNQSFS